MRQAAFAAVKRQAELLWENADAKHYNLFVKALRCGTIIGRSRLPGAGLGLFELTQRERENLGIESDILQIPMGGVREPYAARELRSNDENAYLYWADEQYDPDQVTIMNAYNIEHRGPGSMANDNGYERGINRKLKSYKAMEKENTKTTNFP